tara:strand:- start:197 stop:766 length:570 start_codon:yes stop_codon:yes gene_type:complete
MIRIGILGDIGSGKSYVAKNFGYPVFDADLEVGKIYKKNRKIFNKLKKVLPSYIYTFPIKKDEISSAILMNNLNLKKIITVIHPEIRKKMNMFLKKNIKKKFVILDIPLLLENKINKKNDILIFVQSNRLDISKKLKKRKNFNLELIKKFRNIQLSSYLKKEKSQFIIKNDFKKKTVKLAVKKILKEIL